MSEFSPRWVTSNSTALNATPLQEGSSATYTLEAEDILLQTMPPASLLTFKLPSALDSVAWVKVNGAVLDNNRVTKQGRNLNLNLGGLTLGAVAQVEIKRVTDLGYTILYGTLPPGMSLSSSGVISGQLGNITGSEEIAYDFSIRVTNGSTVQDRSFRIRALPVPKTSVWVTANLPPETTDTVLNIDYYPLGSVRRLESKPVAFSTANPDYETPVIEVRRTGLLGYFNEGLPPGLSIVNNSLKGTVRPDVRAGRYLFKLGFVGQLANTIICEIFVLNATAGAPSTPATITWKTPEDLGIIQETYPCHIGLVAEATGKVTYTIAPGSTPMPAGLVLNADTGDIEGYVAHVATETQYVFTIRANVKANYADRQFTLTVANRYNTPETLDVKLKLRTVDRLGLVEKYKQRIPADDVFRPADPNFGIQPEPFVYIIKGLAGIDLEEAKTGNRPDGLFGNDYHGQFSLSLGRHYHAVMRDQRGAVVYEVIYRTLIDAQAMAGGFEFGTERAIEQPILYPQSKDVAQYIYPKSVRNARLDFVKDLGFATDDPSKAILTGVTGVEAMPEWMACEQILGDPKSIMGFFPALVIAYTKPDMAAPIVADLNLAAQQSLLPPPGRSVVLERYFLSDHVNRQGTTFDGGLTTYDGGTTFFDPI